MATPQEPPAVQTREEEILSTALDIFFAQGYRAAPLRDLASTLGINVATLYHYFESKDEILFRLQYEGLGRLLTGAQAALATTAEGSPEERMRALIRAHFRYHTEHYKIARLHFAEYRSLEPASRALVRERMKEYERLFTSLVAEGVASGHFCTAAPKITAFAILGAGSQISYWYRPDGDLSPDEIVDIVTSLVMDGLTARASPKIST